jgi:hypothetical protein
VEVGICVELNCDISCVSCHGRFELCWARFGRVWSGSSVGWSLEEGGDASGHVENEYCERTNGAGRGGCTRVVNFGYLQFMTFSS